MTAPERILTYIQKTYQPEAVVVYGSFADGSAGAGSDFDALVIAGSRACHDASENRRRDARRVCISGGNILCGL